MDDEGAFGGGAFGGGPRGGSEGRLLDGGTEAMYGISLAISFAFLCCWPASNPGPGASGLNC